VGSGGEADRSKGVGDWVKLEAAEVKVAAHQGTAVVNKVTVGAGNVGLAWAVRPHRTVWMLTSVRNAGTANARAWSSVCEEAVPMCRADMSRQ
jgi:hypothetical protein